MVEAGQEKGGGKESGKDEKTKRPKAQKTEKTKWVPVMMTVIEEKCCRLHASDAAKPTCGTDGDSRCDEVLPED